MAKYKIIKTEELKQIQQQVDSMALQLKGYYDDRNEDNEFFQRLFKQAVKGVQLPDLTPMDRDQVAEAYRTMGSVNGVIDYIADNVGEVMKYLELRTTNPDGTYKYYEDHWLMKILRKPNDRYNLRRFGKAWAVNRLLFDDAWTYAPLTKGKDRQIDPKVGMHIIPSHRVTVKSEGLMTPLHGVIIRSSDNKEIEADGKIFESFGYSLDPLSFYGTSKVVAAAIYLSVIDKGMRREDKSLENGGPAAVITPKPDNMGVLPQDADNVEKEFNGDKSFNKIKALRTPVDIHELGSRPVDLGILESHKEAITALCFVYHLPVDLYYGQAKYENAKEAKKAIYEQQAIPLAEEFAADLLSYTKLDEQGFELVINRDEIDVLKEKPTEVLDRLEKMHASLNERRTANGFDPIDEPYANQPMIRMGYQFGNETYDIDETVDTGKQKPDD